MNSSVILPTLYSETDQFIFSALETYSNVHRGSGHFSRATTHLYEKSRDLVLEYLGLSKRRYAVIFCTPWRARTLTSNLNPEDFTMLSSEDFGLPLGLRAVAARKNRLPKGVPFQTGGGTTRLIARDWVVWADAPDRFEAGTPPVINVIAFAKALMMAGKSGEQSVNRPDAENAFRKEIFYDEDYETLTGKDLIEKLRQEHIGKDFYVPTRAGDKRFINLDNGASTPTFKPVWQTYCKTLQINNKDRDTIIRETQNNISSFLGAPLSSYDIIFTANTTEAINLAAEGLSHNVTKETEYVVLNTLLEHNSNDLPWRTRNNLTLLRLEVDRDGFIYLDELDQVLEAYNEARKFGDKRIKLVTVSGASNVMGTYNDLVTICRIAHRYGAKVLVDGAQLAAHRKIDMESAGIDFLAFSGHKTYAPFGSGALIARKGELAFTDEDLKSIRASGEENTAGVAALGKAIRILHAIGMDAIQAEEQALTKQALLGMAKIDGLIIPGINDPEAPRFDDKGAVIVFSLKNFMANVIAKKLAENAGIGTRYGCHCAHLIVKHILNVKPGLERFQHFMVRLIPGIQLPGIARISIGLENTAEDIDDFLAALSDIAAGKKAKGSFHMHDFEKNIERKVFR